MSTIGSGKGMSEKDLLMPPVYDGDILDGYTPHYRQTRKLILLMRVAVPTGHYDEAVALARKLKVYALGNDASAQTYEIVDVKGNPAPLPMLTWEMSMDYWRQFHSVIDHEIAQPRHRFMAGLPNLGGIPKGQAFEPDARMETILTDAAMTGWAIMNVNLFANGHPESLTWPDRNWEFILLIGPLNPETERFRNSQLLGLGLE
ncbi:hypothetical protein DS909_18995 [Phaeobacter gallaeciensis]|uniref:DUF1254 domain-containing protein n=2 Tax=Roseobacteraceae TaxID=2854170 RepID=A0A366WT13_9RHOB|nr:hypothetical protein [Phaeobacter gallaeciensis]RBW51669.1 hypothetical protein DS909_18995 [Phaeobacter gallaeciensis]